MHKLTGTHMVTHAVEAVMVVSKRAAYGVHCCVARVRWEGEGGSRSGQPRRSMRAQRLRLLRRAHATEGEPAGRAQDADRGRKTRTLTSVWGGSLI